MGEGKVGFIIKPSKSLDKIFEEYGVQPTYEQLDEFADEFGDAILDGDLVKAILLTFEFGREIGVPERKLKEFTFDIVKTMLFYMGAVKMIGEILSEG